MGDLQKADGKLAARVGHAAAHTCDRECLARRSTGQQIERAERQRAIDEVGRGDVAQIGMAESVGQHGAGKLLDLGAPQPFGFRQRQLGAADAREARGGPHQTALAIWDRSGSANRTMFAQCSCEMREIDCGITALA